MKLEICFYLIKWFIKEEIFVILSNFLFLSKVLDFERELIWIIGVLIEKNELLSFILYVRGV